MNSDDTQLILIFAAVIVGVISASYFYLSTDVFMDRLKRPLKIISSGMMLMAIGVLLAAFISYEAKHGVDLYIYDIPLQVIF